MLIVISETPDKTRLHGSLWIGPTESLNKISASIDRTGNDEADAHQLRRELAEFVSKAIIANAVPTS